MQHYTGVAGAHKVAWSQTRSSCLRVVLHKRCVWPNEVFNHAKEKLSGDHTETSFQTFQSINNVIEILFKSSLGRWLITTISDCILSLTIVALSNHVNDSFVILKVFIISKGI